jgi:hypothetical protein
VTSKEPDGAGAETVLLAISKRLLSTKLDTSRLGDGDGDRGTIEEDTKVANKDSDANENDERGESESEVDGPGTLLLDSVATLLDSGTKLLGSTVGTTEESEAE